MYASADGMATGSSEPDVLYAVPTMRAGSKGTNHGGESTYPVVVICLRSDTEQCVTCMALASGGDPPVMGFCPHPPHPIMASQLATQSSPPSLAGISRVEAEARLQSAGGEEGLYLLRTKAQPGAEEDAVVMTYTGGGKTVHRLIKVKKASGSDGGKATVTVDGKAGEWGSTTASAVAALAGTIKSKYGAQPKVRQSAAPHVVPSRWIWRATPLSGAPSSSCRDLYLLCVVGG